MQIKTGRQIDEELVHQTTIKIWTASKWVLNNISLQNALQDKAWEASGLTKTLPQYRIEYSVYGPPRWDFEVKIYRMKWKEVRE